MYCKTHNMYANACGCDHSNANGEIQEKVMDVLDTVKEGAVDIFDTVKSAGGFVIEETKEGVEKLKAEGEKLDEKERVLTPVRNSVLVYGALAVLLYALVK